MEPIITAILLFIISLLLLGGSASYLVRALAFIAQKVGVSEFIIGSVILAIGTTLPELTSTVISNLKGIPSLGIGVVIGSIVTNLCLIMGIISMIRTQKLKTKTESKSFIFAILPIFLFMLLGFNGVISRLEGLLLVGIFIIYILYLFNQGVLVSRKRPQFKTLKPHYIIVPLAIFTLIVAAFLLVDTAQSIALVIGVPIAIIGLIFVAFGTSVPELASSIAATLEKEESLAVGDLIGANITVILLIIGIAALLKPIYLTFNQFIIPLAFALFSTFLFISYVKVRKRTDRILGISLLATYVLYLVVTWIGI